MLLQILFFLKQFITKQIPDKFQQIKDNFSNIITLAQSKKDLDIIKHKFEKFISIKNIKNKYY